MANLIYTVPLAENSVNAAVAFNLDANSNANLYVGGGANGQALLSDGAGNLNWGNIGNGTVSNIGTAGSGLGFSLSGGPITTTGTITLTVPNATSLRSSLTIGNVANLDLNGNGATALRGNGVFVAYGNVANLNLNGNASTFLAGNGSFIVPVGTYSNANVANYLPTYTGNIGSSGIYANWIYANYISLAYDITANIGNINTINGTTGNFTGNVNANIFNGNVGNITTINSNTITATTGNITTINGTTINATTGNFSGNVSGGNANLGNLVSANYFSGNGYLLTGINAANANYANFAGNVVNSSQPNITSVGTLTTLSVSGNANIGNIGTAGLISAAGNITGGNIVTPNQLISSIATGTPPLVVTSTTLVPNLNVANASFATNSGTANNANYATTVTGATQSNITSLGTLTTLSVTGNVTANYFIGNGSQLTGIISNTGNANFANYAGNVTVSAQPNITSIGTLTTLSVSGNASVAGTVSVAGNASITGNISVSGNASFTGANVSLGSVSNLKITGGNNSYYLQTDGTGTLTWAAGTGSGNGTAAGANTQIQYTDGAGNFQASAGFTFTSNSNTFNVPGNITSSVNNGNLYMVGWRDAGNLTIPSLFSGQYNFGINEARPNAGVNDQIQLLSYPRLSNTNSALFNSVNIGNLIGNIQDMINVSNTIYIINPPLGSANFQVATTNNLSNYNFYTTGQNSVGQKIHFVNNNFVLTSLVTAGSNNQANIKTSRCSSPISNSWTTTANITLSTTANFTPGGIPRKLSAFNSNTIILPVTYYDSLNPLNNYANIYRSTDSGQTFSGVTLANCGSNTITDMVTSMTYGCNNFVLTTRDQGAGANLSNNTVQYSTDGNTWTVTQPSPLTSPTSLDYRTVATDYTGNLILMGRAANATVAQRLFLAISNDAINWTFYTSNSGGAENLRSVNLTGNLSILIPNEAATQWFYMVNGNNIIQYSNSYPSNNNIQAGGAYIPNYGIIAGGSNTSSSIYIGRTGNIGLSNTGPYLNSGNYAYLGGTNDQLFVKVSN